MTEANPRMVWWIAAFGACLSGAAFLLGSTATGLGAMIGTMVAALNWRVLTWLMARVVRGRRHSSGQNTGLGAVMTLVLLKMIVLAAVCYLLIEVARVDAFGFAIGLTSLVLGLLIGTALDAQSAPQQDPSPSLDRN